MRKVALFFAFAFLFGCASTYGPKITRQQPDVDTLKAGILYDVELHRTAQLDEVITKVSPGARLSVQSMAKRTYSDGSGGVAYKVRTKGQTGWVDKDHVSSPHEYQDQVSLIQQLREEGKTVIPLRQSMSKNSADGVTVSLVVANISTSKTVKYIRSTFELYNGVGDRVEGENTGNSTAKVKLTGPIEDMEVETFSADNLWYSSTGQCAELRGLQVEYIDGTSTTITDLQRMSKFPVSAFERKGDMSSLPVILADPVRLTGDCSYEAQQARK